MKILFNTYTMAFQHPGGGEIVILKLKEYLEKLGHEVKLFDKWNDKIEDYDVIHEFSLLEWEIWKDYKELGKPLVLTPTAWPRIDFKTKLKIKIKKQLSSHNLASFLNYPDIILPTTSIEKERLEELYALSDRSFQVLYNGIDKVQFDDLSFNSSDYLLYVGSIAKNKNLLKAIQVANSTGNKLIIVGAAKPGHEDYYRECKKFESQNIIFYGPLKQGSQELYRLYKNAKCLLVLSEFETCSLVSMEAGSVGTPVILTKFGGTKEVFRDFVNYVDPDNHAEIVEALSHLKSGQHLKAYIEENYYWENIAKKLERIYQDLLDKN